MNYDTRITGQKAAKLEGDADIIANMIRQDYSNGLLIPEKSPIEKIRESNISMSDKPKSILLKIRAAISGMSMELINHYHARKYNWALSKYINQDLGYDAIRVYGSTVYFTSRFKKEIGK